MREVGAGPMEWGGREFTGDDLRGRQFGELFCVEFVDFHGTQGQVRWRFVCSCGASEVLYGYKVKSLTRPKRACRRCSTSAARTLYFVDRKRPRRLV